MDCCDSLLNKLLNAEACDPDSRFPRTRAQRRFNVCTLARPIKRINQEHCFIYAGDNTQCIFIIDLL